LGYVEALNDARTLLADFFSVLQETATPRLRMHIRGTQGDRYNRLLFP
jgi:hypothetical protein